MKKVLIAGANSYIGTNVEKWLLREPVKYCVETLDMVGTEWKKKEFCGYDVVYYVAGIAHADIGHISEKVIKKYYEVNTELTLSVAKKAKSAGVKQFIFMSSRIIYGDLEHITRKTEPCPANFYGDSKWKADCGVRELADETFKVAVLRPPMIYGKDSKGNYPLMAKMAVKLPVFPKVNNKRSLLYIDNLCEFVKLIIDNEETGVFFPQNKELANTSDIVREIAKTHGHHIWITVLFTPLAWIGKYIPGRIGAVCKKAFGNGFYDLEMSEYKQDYIVYELQRSIYLTESGDR